ncbi:hypothetical protein JTB14_036076 [Gonioctena quinquepunctata]|nr:hypothetical protein JTB14_036076 [Gonioctena quinquepunctata]
MSDQTIEQTLMRMFKSSGGLTHGRSISESTLASWTLGMIRLQDVCEQITEYCNITLDTSEQHVDYRDARDEVLAISEKVVIRVEDLITWIIVEAEWTWGRLAKCEGEVEAVDTLESVPPRKATGLSFTSIDSGLDFYDVENERKNLDSYKNEKGPHVVILSFPKYCRYRGMMKRLEGVEDVYLKYKIVNALGGFYVIHPNTRVLFCKDTFDYPELEGHELLCNHLTPKLKGRPRGKRKKRSVSPGSESNESESSHSTNNLNTRGESKDGLRCESGAAPRRSTRCHENNENKDFLRKLGSFMKSNRTPIGRIPSLGYKELNLYEFYTKVQKLGGYDCVTGNRLWKTIFDDMSGHQNSTSAATVIRRHYERFLLSYERHIRGEEYKPLPISERRRLKSKRGCNSMSDPESSSCDNIAAATTSKKSLTAIASSENKEIKTEGKTSSLRSVRVKSDRQKDKQIQSEKHSLQNNNNNKYNSENWQPTTNTYSEISSPEIKPKIDKLIMKTESMTVKTELSTVITQSKPVKIEYATVKMKIETNLVKTERSPVKVEESSFVKIENLASSSVKIEPAPIKIEKNSTPPVKSEPLTMSLERVKKEVTETKEDTISIKTESVVCPVTTAATTVSVGVVMPPVEGKENIPLITTDEGSAKSNLEVIEGLFKPQISEIIEETDTFRNNFSQEVKKRKLDILKEGGLEVTPVRPLSMSSTKDGRPSVIHQTMPVQMVPKPGKIEVMPPPTSTAPQKRIHITNIQSHIGHVKNTSKTPTKKIPPCTTSFAFANGSTPPKVVQSKSIYSYSEKTIYGNPKDILCPTMKAMAHTPKFVDCLPRYNGGDPVDLSVNSPQKPVIEIMRVPYSSSCSPYNRDSVTKNLYKTNSPLMDGRRLGPNLEITLVAPNSKNVSNAQKLHNFTQTSSSQMHIQSGPHQSLKMASADYYSPRKSARNEVNRKHNKSPSPHVDANMFTRPETSSSSQMKMMSQSPSSVKHYTNQSLPTFPPYLSQLYEQASKGLPPYLPLIDPATYYAAAVQNMYSTSAMNSAPLIPIPSPEQLKFYAELMAQNRLPFPFQLPTDTSVNNKNMKKQ